jgi:Bacterial Ig-like domain (group 3)
MKLNLRRAIASASVLAVAGGVLAASALVAYAATTPPWEPDPNALGSLTLYNSSGQVVTGGSNLAHLFDYAEASTPDAANGTKATLYFAQPTPGEATGIWLTALGSASTTFPNTSAPAPLNTATNPVVTLAATDADLTNFIASSTAQTATGYANVYQIRLETTGAGGTGSQPNGQYWEDDILVNPTAGTWSIEYPAQVTPTTTTLTASPATATVGVSDTLTATELPATAGSVQFENGGTDIGSPVAVNGSGVATLATTFTAAGTESLSAVFTPTDTTDYSGSTGTLSLTVNPAATPTTTSLTVSQSGTTGTDVSMSSTVLAGTTPVTAGTVSWYDNGSTTPLDATPVTPNASGVATFDIPAGLAAGSHSIVAVFTPTTPADFESSQSAPQQFILQAPTTGACAQTGSNCTETQNIEATIPVGTLVLSTPYTATSPLNLGTLALNAGLTGYTANAPFNGITIVDTRAGDLPWTLTALASNLTDGGTNPGSTICGQNVGLTGVTSTPGAGFAGTVTSTAQAAASPAVAPSGTPAACPTTAGGLVGAGGTPVTVATASAGLGTDVLNGTLTLNAPTSTEPGLFTGTITFTVG